MAVAMQQVAQRGLPVVIDDEHRTVAAGGFGAAGNLRFQFAGGRILQAQLHQFHPHVHAADDPVGIAHHAIQRMRMARLQQGARHGGEGSGTRRAQQRKMAALACEVCRHMAAGLVQRCECGHHAQQGGIGGAEAALRGQCSGIGCHRAHFGTPARRLGQRGMQPALHLRAGQVQARRLFHIAGGGQHGMLLAGQGDAQVLPALLGPVLDGLVTRNAGSHAGQAGQRRLPVEHMHGHGGGSQGGHGVSLACRKRANCVRRAGAMAPGRSVL